MRIMNRLLCCLLLGLAGCAAHTTDSPDTPRGRCERDALRDPQVLEATQQTRDVFVTNRNAALRVQLRVTREAVNRCLAPLGLAEPGGVEPLQH